LTSFGPRNRREMGLQPAQTALAWTRTSFAVLANGALLMVRNLHGEFGFRGDNGSFRLFAVGVAIVLALCTYLIGVRRQRILARRPLPQRMTPRREVHLVGISVLVLIVASALALVV
jgi:uncharacterized membrane protein YidH (DUF202 family)